MKTSLKILFLFSFLNVYAGVDDLISVIRSGNNAVQAIHGYPKNVQEGNHHWVEIKSIIINNGNITIVENWTNFRKKTSVTTLTGKINNGVANGSWESSFSGGSWYYDFNKGAGKWNKAKSIFDSFDEMQPLVFKSVSKTDLKDGFFPYNF